jgi:NAD(P)-dependent dehydrogenase (short-subunit alcohol dehydrogenase family)
MNFHDQIVFVTGGGSGIGAAAAGGIARAGARVVIGDRRRQDH